jgi:vacuolar-type H+-ATPase subunit E/Vma4
LEAEAGVQSVLEEIRSLGSARVQEIEAEARARADRILSDADAEASELREAILREAVAPAQRERAQILHQARQQALKILDAGRQEVVDLALSLTRQRLAAFRQDPDYPAVIDQLVAEALTALHGSLTGDELPHLAFDPDDRDQVERALSSPEDERVLQELEMDSWGGVIARSPDGRVVIDNTLEARLIQATPFLRRNLPRLLKGGQDEADPEGR